MPPRYTISEHAVRRFRQRFGYVQATIEELLAGSVVYGGQYGPDYLLLNEQYQIVFPVTKNKQDAEHLVKTVLSLSQAQANISRFSGLNFDSADEAARRKRCDELREKAEANAAADAPPPPVQPFKHLVDEQPAALEQIVKCKEAAAKLVAKSWHFPDKKEVKALYKELKAEIAITKTQFDEVFLPEVGRLIREKRQQLGVQI
jgi:hypothetical protein